MAAGLTEPMARRFIGFYSDIREAQPGETSHDLETLLGRSAASLGAGLAEIVALVERVAANRPTRG